MTLNRGDRILFLNADDRVRAGCVEDLIEREGASMLFVSTEAGMQAVPLERLRALVTLRAKPRSFFGEHEE